MQIKIHFYKAKSLIGWIISYKTSSIYTHTSIEIDWKIWEANEFEWVTVSNKHKHNDFDTITINAKHIIDWLTFLQNQLWKKYDFAWVLWIWFLKFWQNEKKRFCSELVMQFLKEIKYINNVKNEWVTPWNLYFALKFKEDI